MTHPQELREALAALCHAQWSGWMEYLFSKCIRTTTRDFGEFLGIPAWAVERWKRQMKTDYRNLTEEEKESDRKEADRILALLPSPQGSRSEAEGSNPPSSPPVLEGDETLRETVLRAKSLLEAHGYHEVARRLSLLPQPRPVRDDDKDSALFRIESALEALSSLPVPSHHDLCGSPLRYSQDGNPYCLKCGVNIAPVPSQASTGTAQPAPPVLGLEQAAYLDWLERAGWYDDPSVAAAFVGGWRARGDLPAGASTGRECWVLFYPNGTPTRQASASQPELTEDQAKMGFTWRRMVEAVAPTQDYFRGLRDGNEQAYKEMDAYLRKAGAPALPGEPLDQKAPSFLALGLMREVLFYWDKYTASEREAPGSSESVRHYENMLDYWARLRAAPQARPLPLEAVAKALWKRSVGERRRAKQDWEGLRAFWMVEAETFLAEISRPLVEDPKGEKQP